jgi:L-threonylcarbamoyladenylate synthase
MVRIVPASPSAWQEARVAIQAGQVVAFPTDTVYGVGCHPYEVGAIQAIYRVKGRSATKALPLLLSGTEQLARAALVLPESATKLGQHFWPGALTVVVKRKLDLPSELSRDDTIAVRVPDHPELRDFIAATGGLLAATSANLSGQPDAQTAPEVASYFQVGLALVVDGGRMSGGVPSTVIDCSRGEPILIRQGAIPLQDIEQVLHMHIERADVQN